jgi:hypothetical protein
LIEPLVDVGGVQEYPYLLVDGTYPLRTYFYALTMMQIEHYISLHQPLCYISFIKKNLLAMKSHQKMLFFVVDLAPWLRHVHQLTQIVKNTTNHDDCPTFINSAIEVL